MLRRTAPTALAVLVVAACGSDPGADAPAGGAGGAADAGASTSHTTTTTSTVAHGGAGGSSGGAGGVGGGGGAAAGAGGGAGAGGHAGAGGFAGPHVHVFVEARRPDGSPVADVHVAANDLAGGIVGEASTDAQGIAAIDVPEGGVVGAYLFADGGVLAVAPPDGATLHVLVPAPMPAFQAHTTHLTLSGYPADTTHLEIDGCLLAHTTVPAQPGVTEVDVQEYPCMDGPGRVAYVVVARKGDEPLTWGLTDGVDPDVVPAPPVAVTVSGLGFDVLTASIDAASPWSSVIAHVIVEGAGRASIGLHDEVVAGTSTTWPLVVPRLPVTRTLSAAVSWPGGSSLSRIAPLADPASDFTLHAEPGMPAATTVDVADLQHPAITWTGAPPADAIELGFSADALNFAVWLPASAAGSFRLPDVPAAWQKPAGKPWGAFLYMGWDEDAASGYAETFVWKSGAPSGAYTGAMGRVVP